MVITWISFCQFFIILRGKKSNVDYSKKQWMKISYIVAKELETTASICSNTSMYVAYKAIM